MFPNKWVLFWDGLPVGLDDNSGGYPFKATYPSGVKYWNSKEEAQHYADMFIEERFLIKEIQFRIVG